MILSVPTRIIPLSLTQLKKLEIGFTNFQFKANHIRLKKSISVKGRKSSKDQGLLLLLQLLYKLFLPGKNNLKQDLKLIKIKVRKKDKLKYQAKSGFWESTSLNSKNHKKTQMLKIYLPSNQKDLLASKNLKTSCSKTDCMNINNHIDLSLFNLLLYIRE